MNGGGRWFDPDSGSGFITSINGSPDILAHCRKTASTQSPTVSRW